MNPADHTKYIITCVSFLSFTALTLGGFLEYKGFAGGAVLIGAGGNGLTGLIGYLGGRTMSQRPATSVNVEPPSNVTVNQPTERSI